MRVLALDSAFGSLSVAASEGEAIVASLEGDPGAKAAETLPGLVARVLVQAQWSLAQADRIAVTLGPGGFTSLRAGLAFAKGLAVGAGKPLLGFTTLEALAVSAPRGPGLIASVIDAKRDEVFLQVFAGDFSPLCEAAVVPLEGLGTAFAWPPALRVCGSGAGLLAARIGIPVKDLAIATPQASALALHSQKFDAASRPAQAVYLRPADARPMA
jgi:tRNA threonylcarbamoyl adenosine modification protein YeaZ